MWLSSKPKKESIMQSEVAELTTKGRDLVLKAIPIVEGIDAEFFSKERIGLIDLLNSLKHLI